MGALTKVGEEGRKVLSGEKLDMVSQCVDSFSAQKTVGEKKIVHTYTILKLLKKCRPPDYRCGNYCYFAPGGKKCVKLRTRDGSDRQ